MYNFTVGLMDQISYLYSYCVKNHGGEIPFLCSLWILLWSALLCKMPELSEAVWENRFVIVKHDDGGPPYTQLGNNEL